MPRKAMKVVVELDIHTVSLLGRSLEEFLQNLLPLLTTPDVCLWSNEISDLSAFFFAFQVTCPGTFLRDYGYVYLKVNCMGLEVNTKSVAPTFPLFFHERLRFERVSYIQSNLTLVISP